MISRIRLLMAYKQLSSTQFADAIEIPRATVSHLLSERNKPSLDVITKIISAFRDINPNWLLLGEGEMKLGTAAALQHLSAPAPDAVPKYEQLKTGDAQTESVTVPATPPSIKEVEQVIVFYKDKSFTSYQPS